MTSVIIPAHNEEKTIRRTLDALLTGLPETVEVIVVCNGCSDQTEKAVQQYPKVQCISTAIPSKANALNLGDAAASSHRRIYLDADVVLQGKYVPAIEEKLNEGYLAVSPSVAMAMEGAPWPVRAYYGVWLALPYARAGMIGAGCYALSETGRKRFSAFPDIIADDGYVRALFQEHERTIVERALCVVSAPHSIGGLIKIKTRSRLGRYELKRKFPKLSQNEVKAYGTAVTGLGYKFWKWPDIAAYLFINIYTRARARRQLHDGFSHWERDETTRL